MKLNTAQVARTENQLPVEALPDDHPLMPRLNEIWGEHTYFIDGSGLSIVEPATAAMDAKTDVPNSDIRGSDAGELGVVVNLAHWTNSNPPKLEAHEPELTTTTVSLGTNGGED